MDSSLAAKKQKAAQKIRKKFYKVTDHLKSLSFYLLEDQCEKINILKKEIEPKLQANFRIVYRDFVPHKEMNESFFI